MADITIPELTTLAEAPADADELVVYDTDAVALKRIVSLYFVTTTDGDRVSFTGGGVGVTRTGSETWTSKTFSAPTIGDLTNATHTHVGASTGGAIDVVSNRCIHIVRSEFGNILTDTDTTYDDDIQHFSSFWLDARKIPSSSTVKLYCYCAKLGDSAEIELYDGTYSSSVSGSEISVTALMGSPTLVVSGDIYANMTAGFSRYYLRMKAAPSVSNVYIYSAYLVISS